MKSSTLISAIAGITALSSSLTFAQPSFYRDGTMTVPTGAVITANKQAYYSDIVLSADSSGKLNLVSATRLPLVAVDSVTATVSSELDGTVTLNITGNKSVPCVVLKAAAVSRKDATYTVLLAETLLGPAESCIAVLDPFDTNVTLDAKGLAAGTYEVLVNGVQASFELSADLP